MRVASGQEGRPRGAAHGLHSGMVHKMGASCGEAAEVWHQGEAVLFVVIVQVLLFFVVLLIRRFRRRKEREREKEKEGEREAKEQRLKFTHVREDEHNVGGLCI